MTPPFDRDEMVALLALLGIVVEVALRKTPRVDPVVFTVVRLIWVTLLVIVIARAIGRVGL